MTEAARSIDDPIELSRLVPVAELDEMIESVRRALGGELAVFDRRGQLLAGTSAAGAPRVDIEDAGERIGRIAASGPNADTAMQLLGEMLSVVVHHASARDLAALTHDQAMTATFAELTEQNQRLSRAVVRLEELDRLKSNFLATMSHELRTPLTSVIGYAEMMAEGLAGAVTSEQKDYLTTILGKADQLLGLITAVLDVSSLEGGTLALERTQVCLAELVENEVATFQAQASRRGIAIELAVDGSATIVGDKRKLRQVVSSLVSNAVKFTPDQGSVGVTVRRGPLGPDAGVAAVQLVVRDSGIGIRTDQVAKIFEPFFQVDSSSTRAFGGTGLGLTLAKAYVEAHGGRIWVDTEAGQGSTFVATFPESV